MEEPNLVRLLLRLIFVVGVPVPPLTKDAFILANPMLENEVFFFRPSIFKAPMDLGLIMGAGVIMLYSSEDKSMVLSVGSMLGSGCVSAMLRTVFLW